jgi:hypothetical protein
VWGSFDSIIVRSRTIIPLRMTVIYIDLRPVREENGWHLGGPHRSPPCGWQLGWPRFSRESAAIRDFEPRRFPDDETG